MAGVLAAVSTRLMSDGLGTFWKPTMQLSLTALKRVSRRWANQTGAQTKRSVAPMAVTAQHADAITVMMKMHLYAEGVFNATI